MILAPHTIKAVLPPNSLNSWEVFQPHIDRAWLKYFPRYLGHAYMQELQQTEENNTERKKAQNALAWFALAESIPFLDLVLTSTGFGIVSNPNIAPASTERVKALATAAMQAGLAATNDMLEQLSISLPAAWNRCCLLENALLRNANELQQFVNTEATAIRFMNLMPGLRQLEALHFIPLLGQAQFHQMVTSHRNDPASLLMQRAAALLVTASEEPLRYQQGQELLVAAISRIKARPAEYPLYHQEMMEAAHQNNENDYPVFG